MLHILIRLSTYDEISIIKLVYNHGSYVLFGAKKNENYCNLLLLIMLIGMINDQLDEIKRQPGRQGNKGRFASKKEATYLDYCQSG